MSAGANGFTIAVDGPAASGKGTLSKRLARELGFAHLDTGLLYRAVGRAMLQGEDPVEAALTLDGDAVDGPDLRSAGVGQAASRVAAIPEVRAALVDFQRAFARRAGGAVLDGRDIGTVICPEAEVKLFVTAEAPVRAERRWRELVASGQSVDYDTVLQDMRDRDARDMGRSDAPLRPAEDALHIDTSRMDIDEALAAALSIVEARRG